MSEKPIIFSGPMVRAILEGKKTQTRRVIKRLPGCDMSWVELKELRYPYEIGDLLWVRETWADTNGECGPMILYKAGGGDRFLTYESYPVDYSKYPNCTFTMWCGDLRRGEPGHSWRSPIHMPRWASRITLKITDIRPECLPDIAHEDAIAEGSSGIDEYRELWDSLNSKRGYGWEANPWVWVIEFERVQEAKP